MKIKKSILLVISILIMLGITTLTTKVRAADSVFLGLEEYRSSGYAYKSLNDKIMWKISVYNSSTGPVTNKKRAIYCIKGGPGFGSAEDMGKNPVIKEYKISYDLKNLNKIDEPYKSKLPTGQNYNSLIWVLEHCYVPYQNENEKADTEAFRAQLLKDAGIQNSKITDDEIDVVQQLSVWYFTNSDSYKVTDEIFSLWIKQATVDSEYQPLGDKFGREGDDRSDDAMTLFSYFINNAKNAGAPTQNVNTVEVVQDKAITKLIGDNYIVGPYRINQVNNQSYDISLQLTTADESKNITYKLLDSNKNETSTPIKNMIGQDFYLSIPKTENIKNAKLKVTTGVYQTNITYRSVEGASAAEQPVAEVTRKKNPYYININIPKLSEFDLALRKFITKINNEEVKPSREPQENIEELANGNSQTAIKSHPKNALPVKPGDTVLYTIRVYNEGDLNGYVKEITDYLPTGLILKEGSKINSDYGWTTTDGKTIKTTKLQNVLLNKFDGTKLEHADVEVECTVVAENSADDIKLKNIAEITKHSDEEGNTNIVDRDSVPDNLTEDQKNNYNPGTSTQGWGYEDDDDFEDLIIPGKYFDLALRKFITNINGKELVDSNGKYLREPTIDVTNLANGTSTTASYKHRKDPVGVSVGDIVIYTLRVYNEGERDGYANSVTDYLPPQLEFVIDDEEQFNAKYGWVIDSSLRKATTAYLSIGRDAEENLMKAFDPATMTTPDYKELKIKCRVKSVKDLQKVITNIAEVTEYSDKNGNTNIIDRDSTANSLTNDNSKPADSIPNDNLPEDKDLPDYKGLDDNKSILTDPEYFYKGQQDDDDFEKLILEEFDLALRKFITGVNDKEVTNRIPKFTTNKDKNGNYIYEHTKEPVEVETTDIVEYTIRIFNEGDISGYAKQVKDDIPSGLEFLPDNSLNKEYRWKMLDKNGNETTKVEEAESIVTDYLSKEQEVATGRNNLIKAFDTKTMSSPAYKDVKVAFKVVAPNSFGGIITNIAQISDDSDEDGNEVEDKDSTPDNDKEDEDDIDKEHIKLSYFDLALRKFITAVNDKEITNRIPVFKIDENGNYIYEHTKEPVDVENGNIVTYTLRIFNEGTKDGYAKQIKDDLPEGLLFLPENELNKEYRWKMLDKDGNETTEVEKADSIVTDYLSKEQADATGRDNLLTAFKPETMEQPNYRDIKIAFKVTEPNTSDRILINKAQISDDSDKDGNDVVDKDSTPDKWIEGEDDQDIEKVKVKYFDLALRKWVTQAIVIENGKEVVTETGHKAEDDPEAPVKVELVASKINKVVVKFRYKIRITNEGEIAGSATEISDYIPKGLKFVQADNPKWKEVDGKVVTDQLKDKILQPGESAEVEILLTWINGKDNMGLKTNIAEISKDWNDSDTPDIDSTPNNKKEGEDDIDDAPVILSVKTGEEATYTYIILFVGGLMILAGGVIIIKKYII